VQSSSFEHLLFFTTTTFQRRFLNRQLCHQCYHRTWIQQMNSFRWTRKVDGILLSLEEVYRLYFHFLLSEEVHMQVHIQCILWYTSGVKIGCHFLKSKLNSNMPEDFSLIQSDGSFLVEIMHLEEHSFHIYRQIINMPWGKKYPIYSMIVHWHWHFLKMDIGMRQRSYKLQFWRV
jgi:hypothetical protein